MKSCTPLWREAHFEVKMHKTPQLRTAFGSCDVEKVYAVVARSTFPSQNVQSTPWSDRFWKLRCRKSARRFWREAHYQVKMYKTHHGRTTFGSCDVEKVHAVVARSTFRSQNVQNTPWSDHFWKLRCRKRARRCGAKHISKSKCTKHHMFAPLLEVAMSKKCTPLWCEARFQVKMCKTPQLRTTFGSCDVEKVHAVVARSTFPSQNVQNTPWSDQFWKLQCRKSARRCGAKHIAKSKCTKHTMVDHFWKLRCRTLHYTTLHNTTTTPTQLHSTTLHYTPLHYIPLHYTTTTRLHSTTLHCTKLHYTTVHDTTLHSTTLHYTTLLHYTTFHYTSLHYTTLHSTTLQLQLQLHSTTLHYTNLHHAKLHYTTLHCTTLHSTTLHYTTLQYTTLH